MPTYEFQCKKCNKTFTVMLALAEHEKSVPACPKCKSRKVQQKPAGFFAVSAKKS